MWGFVRGESSRAGHSRESRLTGDTALKAIELQRKAFKWTRVLLVSLICECFPFTKRGADASVLPDMKKQQTKRRTGLMPHRPVQIAAWLTFAAASQHAFAQSNASAEAAAAAIAAGVTAAAMRITRGRRTSRFAVCRSTGKTVFVS